MFISDGAISTVLKYGSGFVLNLGSSTGEDGVSRTS